MCFGAAGSSINAMTMAVPQLVHGLTRGLFRADVERHWASFRAYDVPQAAVAAENHRSSVTLTRARDTHSISRSCRFDVGSTLSRCSTTPSR